MIMLLEQDQMGQYCRLHLTIAFGLLEPLLRLSILFRPHQIYAFEYKTKIYGFAYMWWRRRVPPPGPIRLCRSSQRPKHTIYYILFLWDVKCYSTWFSNSSNNGDPTPRWSVTWFTSRVPYNALTDGRHKTPRQTQTKKHHSDGEIYLLHNPVSSRNCFTFLANSGI